MRMYVESAILIYMLSYGTHMHRIHAYIHVDILIQYVRTHLDSRYNFFEFLHFSRSHTLPVQLYVYIADSYFLSSLIRFLKDTSYLHVEDKIYLFS